MTLSQVWPTLIDGSKGLIAGADHPITGEVLYIDGGWDIIGA